MCLARLCVINEQTKLQFMHILTAKMANTIVIVTSVFKTAIFKYKFSKCRSVIYTLA